MAKQKITPFIDNDIFLLEKIKQGIDELLFAKKKEKLMLSCTTLEEFALKMDATTAECQELWRMIQHEKL